MPKILNHTDERDAYIVAQYKRGRTTRCISEELGISTGTILLRLEAAGVQRRPRGPVVTLTIDVVKVAKAMNDDRVPWKVICRKTGFSYTPLKTAVRELRKAERGQAA